MKKSLAQEDSFILLDIYKQIISINNFSLLKNSITINFYILVLTLVLFIPHANSCEFYQRNDISFSCTYCKQPINNCTIRSNFTSKFYNNLSLCSQCCNSSATFKSKVFNTCSSNSNSNNQSTSQSELNLANILIICFFAVPGLVCIFIIIATIIRSRQRQRNRRNNQPPLTPVNLSDYNLDQIAPAFIDNSHVCSICLEEKPNIITKCRHVYHSDCLRNWIHKRQNCPQCRTKQFNPLAIYCGKCFKATKITYLIDNMDAQKKQQWSKYKDQICNECLHDNNEISIDFTLISEKQVKKQDIKKNNAQNQCNESNKQLKNTSI